MPIDEAQCQSVTFKREIWDPLEKRCDIMVMTQEMPPYEDEPYSVNQLAHAMQFMTEYPQLI
jgi:hypothetical protein